MEPTPSREDLEGLISKQSIQLSAALGAEGELLDENLELRTELIGIRAELFKLRIHATSSPQAEASLSDENRMLREQLEQESLQYAGLALELESATAALEQSTAGLQRFTAKASSPASPTVGVETADMVSALRAVLAAVEHERDSLRAAQEVPVRAAIERAELQAQLRSQAAELAEAELEIKALTQQLELLKDCSSGSAPTAQARATSLEENLQLCSEQASQGEFERLQLRGCGGSSAVALPAQSLELNGQHATETRQHAGLRAELEEARSELAHLQARLGKRSKELARTSELLLQERRLRSAAEAELERLRGSAPMAKESDGGCSQCTATPSTKIGPVPTPRSLQQHMRQAERALELLSDEDCHGPTCPERQRLCGASVEVQSESEPGAGGMQHSSEQLTQPTPRTLRKHMRDAEGAVQCAYSSSEEEPLPVGCLGGGGDEKMICVVGYGSLLSAKTAAYVFGGVNNFELAWLQGWKRSCCYVCPQLVDEKVLKHATEKEAAAVGLEPCHGATAICVSVFEVTLDKWRGFLMSRPDLQEVEATGLSGGQAAVMAVPLREPARRRQLETSFGQGPLWREDLLPCRVQLRHCVLAAETLGDDAMDNFMKHTVLADGLTTVKQHLVSDTSIMLETPTDRLQKSKYNG